jgi:hypothetical protein
MISLEPEIVGLRQSGAIDEATAARLIAAERREIVSVYGELRFLTWGGVMLIVSGVGVLVSKHLDKIGPVAIAAAIGIASLACYAIFVWRRRSGRQHLADDYVLLLAALLASADVGYIESQFHLLGSNWQRHFLLLAVLHGVTAYLFNSRLVLSLSITALAAYIGIERKVEAVFDSGVDFAVRAFICAATLMVWRAVQRKREFAPVFDHAAANLAFWGSIGLLASDDTRLLGCAIALVLAAFCAWHGFRRGEEAFVIYAYVYGAIAIDVQIGTWLHEEALILIYLILSTIAVIVGLFVTHARMRKVPA